MTMTFTVYDNHTNKIICSDVDWDTAEEYVDNDNYTVVNNLNGMFLYKIQKRGLTKPNPYGII